MALFGDEDDNVGPFVMAEGGEEWFPFTLDNLEMDRACSSAQDDARPMDQVRGSWYLPLSRLHFFCFGGHCPHRETNPLPPATNRTPAGLHFVSYEFACMEVEPRSHPRRSTKLSA